MIIAAPTEHMAEHGPGLNHEAYLLDQFVKVRQQTMSLISGLSAEDLTAQSMPDASPGKWHLAHTTWFFETFILQKFEPHFRWFDEKYCYLFNSYYDSVGRRHARPQRGLLTRPSLADVLAYREAVDQRMQSVMAQRIEDFSHILTIGLHHEMQHQELFLTDVLHLFSHNPLHPAIVDLQAKTNIGVCSAKKAIKSSMVILEGGLLELGAETAEQGTRENFSYDCEQPRHRVYLEPFKLATQLVNNGEWLEFIDDGGYEDSLLWMSDGWSRKTSEHWQAPLYWQKVEGVWHQYGLDGLQPVDPTTPVHHVSYYEADAFARWAGCRLPREQEWESVAAIKAIKGNFLESLIWRPFAAKLKGEDFEDIYGDVWEWTQSAFSPYPGFVSRQGALGEYNAKFMANQFVLRGGSCVTPQAQMRASYRNFFYPHQRWQFSGVRLAEDA